MNALEPVAETDGEGNLVSLFVYAERPNTPSYLLKAGQLYRIISDQLGSVRLVVNVADGSIAQRIDYDAWGNITEDTHPGFQPFGFAGGILNPDTGLTRFGARDYDPETGRWTSKDPIGFRSDGTGTYTYSLNDPINHLDPDGEFIWIAAGAAIGAAISIASTVIANGGNVTGKQILAAAVSGAIAGAVGAVAGPLGGTIAKALGQSASGLLATGASTVFSGVGGALGQAASNEVDSCNAASVANAALFGGLGGGVASKFFPVKGMYTLKQAKYFAPSTFSGINGSGFNGAAGVSSGVGAAAAFGGPF